MFQFVVFQKLPVKYGKRTFYLILSSRKNINDAMQFTFALEPKK